VFEYDNCGICNGDDQSCLSYIELSIGSVADGVMEIILDNTMPLLGFQFNVSGVELSDGSGGSAGAAGFQVNTGVDGMVLGFSMIGAEIPAGNGVLTNIQYIATGDEACLSNEVFALGEWSGGFYDIIMGDCVALDYCESGMYDCTGICDGSAVEDCAGECNGSAVEDVCGECNGDGSSTAEPLHSPAQSSTAEPSHIPVQSYIPLSQ
jgi:hypothetical protein